MTHRPLLLPLRFLRLLFLPLRLRLLLLLRIHDVDDQLTRAKSIGFQHQGSRVKGAREGRKEISSL